MSSKDKTKHVPRELRSLQSHNREKEDEGIGAAIEEEDEVGGGSRNTRGTKRRKVSQHPTTTATRGGGGGGGRTRAGKRNDNIAGDTTCGENKRKRNGVKSNTAAKATEKKKKAATTKTKALRTKKKETIALESPKAGLTSPTHSIIKSPAAPSSATKNNTDASVLGDCSNTIMGGSTEDDRKSEGRGMRTKTPTKKKQALEENRKKLRVLVKTKSPVQLKKMNDNSSDTKWVQCDECGKWRELPPDISADKLPDIWDCSMNTWQPAFSSCNADEEDKENAELDDVTTTVHNNLPPTTTKNNSDGGHAPSSTKNFLTPKEPVTPRQRFSFGQNQKQLSASKSASSRCKRLENDDNNETEREITTKTVNSKTKNLTNDDNPSHDSILESDYYQDINELKEPNDYRIHRDPLQRDDKEKKEDNKGEKESDTALQRRQQQEVEAKAAAAAEREAQQATAFHVRQQQQEAEARAAAAVEQEQRELEEEAAAALQKQKEARAAALQKEKEAREAAAAVLKSVVETVLSVDDKGDDKKKGEHPSYKPVNSDIESETEKEEKEGKKKDNSKIKIEDSSIPRLLDEEKVPRSTMRGKLDVAVLIHNIPNNMKVDVLSKMDAIIKSPSLKYLRLNDPITDPNDVLLPLYQTIISNDDIKSLSRDPKTTSDSHLLYGGYTIHELCTQIMYLKNNNRNWCCTLPANIFELISSGGMKYEIDNYLDKMLNSNRHIGDNLLNYKVVSILVWHGMHFSKAYILNASLVLNGDWRYNKAGTKEPHPCILYTNSTGNTKWHNPKKVAEKIRTLLNGYSIAYGKTKKRGQFNTNSMPVYQIEGMIYL